MEVMVVDALSKLGMELGIAIDKVMRKRRGRLVDERRWIR